MNKIKPEEFKKLSLVQRYKLLQERGNFIASRQHGGHLCHLFAFDGFYVEMYKVIGMNQVQWIEVVKNDRTLDSYLDNF
ncbi:hypothetical protein GYB57_03825 [bacterium]|jgi:hypothetical protein|nr:hypothetical protein [bacterium]